ncbi:uncharacterized protein N7459_007916 [Penicillium hispanicum]|uniref:uncharacterized protein n=1 Tax=Penicillium hispanicum TaxID=1080232 RepID=UPI002540583F|nr:uncharacterized protein N7459_007916 [Penicillium hispanicum]KAJ5573489.1 hypothetical protein N7459_007916 [Penicillium hispanicum]
MNRPGAITVGGKLEAAESYRQYRILPQLPLGRPLPQIKINPSPMASNLSVRMVRSACLASRTSARPLVTLIPRRTIGTSPDSAPEDSAGEAPAPRWSYTPPQTKAPFSLRLHSNRPPFRTNSNSAVLDDFYVRLLGPGGDQVLPEELKWLAVTHKSFDQGRRGFNDRLAFLGKRIVTLQASVALVQNPQATHASTPTSPDEHGREPFSHPALDGLKNLTADTTSILADRSKMAELANKYELQKVLRWAPAKPGNLEASGVNLVLSHTLFAIIGAVAMAKGGHVANQVVRERILEPLGVSTKTQF